VPPRRALTLVPTKRLAVVDGLYVPPAGAGAGAGGEGGGAAAGGGRRGAASTELPGHEIRALLQDRAPLLDQEVGVLLEGGLGLCCWRGWVVLLEGVGSVVGGVGFFWRGRRGFQ
jgi:hypothetical protein